MTALQLTALVFCFFVGGLTIIFGVQPSISKFYYKLKEAKEGLQYLFTVFMFFIGGMVIYMGTKGVHSLTSDLTFWFGGLFLMYVGVFPRFEDDQEKQHYICALLGLLFTLSGFYFRDNNWQIITSFLLIASLLYRLKVNNLYLWVELVAVVGVFWGFK